MAFNVVAFGLKLPLPLVVHAPVVMPPEMLPLKLTAGLDEHKLWSAPALTVTAGLMVTTN